MRRRDFLVATAGLAAACNRPGERLPIAADTGVAPAPRAASSPLVLVDAGGPGGFGAYLGEMLGGDGVIGLASVDPATDSVAALSNAAGIVVYGSALTIALDRRARSGRPPGRRDRRGRCLARRCWRDSACRTTASSRRSAYASRIVPTRRRLRLHVDGRRWTAGRDSRVMASFAGTADGADAPAALHIAHGRGRVTAWAFDVARNVACIRQGNPEWTGSNRDAFPPQQLIDAMIGWITPDDAGASRRGSVPAGADRRRWPAAPARPDRTRCWTTSRRARDRCWSRPRTLMPSAPRRSRACSDGSRTPEDGCRSTTGRTSPLAGAGRPGGCAAPSRSGRWSAAWPPTTTPRRRPIGVAAWRARGHEFAPHPDIDDESIALDARFERAWQVFADEGYGVRHLSTRTHRILWSGWAQDRPGPAPARRAHEPRRLQLRSRAAAARRPLGARSPHRQRPAAAIRQRGRHAGRLLPAADADRRRGDGPRVRRARRPVGRAGGRGRRRP